jgi:hypothetical protein
LIEIDCAAFGRTGVLGQTSGRRIVKPEPGLQNSVKFLCPAFGHVAVDGTCLQAKYSFLQRREHRVIATDPLDNSQSTLLAYSRRPGPHSPRICEAFPQSQTRWVCHAHVGYATFGLFEGACFKGFLQSPDGTNLAVHSLRQASEGCAQGQEVLIRQDD